MASAVSRCLASTARVHARGLVVRVAVAWLAIALSLLVIMPALASVFGSSRLEQAGPGRRAALQRLDRIERLVVAQLDGVRSDLLLIGATNAVRRYLAEDDADADGVSNDLQAFAATRSWCRWTLLAVAGREPVIAERTHEKPVCGSLLEVAAGLSPGTLLLDRVSAPAGPGVRLCFALPLEAGAAGPAVLVAEGDPVVLFARLAALPVADGSPFLSDGHGRWLLEPPSPSLHWFAEPSRSRRGKALRRQMGDRRPVAGSRPRHELHGTRARVDSRDRRPRRTPGPRRRPGRRTAPARARLDRRAATSADRGAT